MKNFAPKPWVVPQPVLIIDTYNKDGVANAMNAAWAGQLERQERMGILTVKACNKSFVSHRQKTTTTKDADCVGFVESQD